MGGGVMQALPFRFALVVAWAKVRFYNGFVQ